MRVEVQSEIQSLKSKLQSSENPPPAETQALRGFRAAVDGPDSVFHLDEAMEGNPYQASGLEGTYAGEFVMRFRRLDLNAERKWNFFLLDRMTELLKFTTASDALDVTLCLRPPDEPNKLAALIVQLEAIGTSQDQAQLRWELGVSHIQQALLFTSRLIQQQLVKGGGGGAEK